MTEIFESEAEVVEWINAYEEGCELPDGVMVKVLHMAQLYAKTLEKHPCQGGCEACVGCNVKDDNI